MGVLNSGCSSSFFFFFFSVLLCSRVASANASLTVNKTKDFKRVARGVKSAAAASNRRDLEGAALARWTRINRTLKQAQKAKKAAAAVAVAAQ